MKETLLGFTCYKEVIELFLRYAYKRAVVKKNKNMHIPRLVESDANSIFSFSDTHLGMEIDVEILDFDIKLSWNDSAEIVVRNLLENLADSNVQLATVLADKTLEQADVENVLKALGWEYFIDDAPKNVNVLAVFDILLSNQSIIVYKNGTIHSQLGTVSRTVEFWDRLVAIN